MALSVGSAWVTLRSDSGAFKDEVRAAIDEAPGDKNIEVHAEVDESSLRDTQARVDSAFADQTVGVKTDADEASLSDTMAQVAAAFHDELIRVGVTLDEANLAIAQGQLLSAFHDELINVGVEVDAASIADAKTVLAAAFQAAHTPVVVGVDEPSLVATTAEIAAAVHDEFVTVRVTADQATLSQAIAEVTQAFHDEQVPVEAEIDSASIERARVALDTLTQSNLTAVVRADLDELSLSVVQQSLDAAGAKVERVAFRAEVDESTLATAIAAFDAVGQKVESVRLGASIDEAQVTATLGAFDALVRLSDHTVTVRADLDEGSLALVENVIDEFGARQHTALIKTDLDQATLATTIAALDSIGAKGEIVSVKTEADQAALVATVAQVAAAFHDELVRVGVQLDEAALAAAEAELIAAFRAETVRVGVQLDQTSLAAAEAELIAAFRDETVHVKTDVDQASLSGALGGLESSVTKAGGDAGSSMGGGILQGIAKVLANPVALTTLDPALILLAGALVGALVEAVAATSAVGLVVGAIFAHADVKPAAQQLGHDFVTEFQAATASWTGPLVTGIDEVDSSMQRLFTVAAPGFEAISRAIEPFFEGVAGFVANLGPGLNEFLRGAAVQLSGLASVLPTLGSDFGTLLDGIGQLSEHTALFKEVLLLLGGVVDGVGIGLKVAADVAVFFELTLSNMIGALEKIPGVGGLVKGALDGVKQSLDKNTEGSDGLSGSTGKLSTGLGNVATQSSVLSTGMGTLNASMSPVLSSLDLMKQKADDANSALNTLHGTTGGVADADLNMHQQLQNLSQSLATNGANIDTNTKSGLANQQALKGAADSVYTLYTKNIEAGMPTQKATELYNQQMAQLYKTAEAAGIDKGTIDKLVASYGDIPANVSTNLSITGYNDAHDKLLELLAEQKAGTGGISLEAARTDLGIGAGGTHATATAKAAGGRIRGEGTATSDSIPIWASDGEYIVNADATERNLPLLEGINSGEVRGYAFGGQVATTAQRGRGGAQTNNWPFPIAAGGFQIPNPPAGPSGPISGDLAQWITQGLGIAGYTQGTAEWNKWYYGIATIAQRESAGNPQAINLWDCLTLDAMILTRRGWLKHDEVHAGDETIGYNFATKRNEWTRVSRVVHYEDAELVRISNSRWSTTTTPNHRWVNLPRLTSDYATEASWVTSDAIRSRDRLLLAAPASTAGSLDITTQEAALLGWIAGDGHVEQRRYGPSMSIAQSKPRFVEKLRALLADVPHAEYSDWRLTRTGKEPCGPRYQFRLDYHYAQDLLRRAGHPKRDAVAQVLAMSTEQRAAWFEAMTDAEGSTQDGHASVSQNDGPVQEAIILAAYLSGHRPRVHRTSRPGQPTWNPGASIALNKPVVTGAFLKREPAGRGAVWCVTTNLGSWTARDGDHVFLTGNSNAQAGHPSKGLLQFIDSTFNSHAMPGHTNIWNPVDQVIADSWAGGYIKAAYGDISNVQQANASLAPMGYDGGGTLPPGPTLAVNSTGKPEQVFTQDQLASLGGDTYVLNFAPGSVVTNNAQQFFDDLKRMARAGAR